MCELTGIEPDLVTLGKIVGGGMPVGACAGRRELLEKLAPTGPVYQAGTLSGNPVAMAAGLATLRELERPGTYPRLEALGARLESGWSAALAAAGVPGQVVRVGSILWLALQGGPAPRCASAIDPRAARRYGPLHAELLERGVWLAPSAFEVAFLSTAHAERHVDLVVAALREGLERAELRQELIAT
jgi:glutamate-1-semialdehyde 2,1-aminomutase